MTHAPHQQQHRTVLVVDDHLDTCEMLVMLLKNAGYSAVCAESGFKALDYLNAGRDPDLMILDVTMPDMTGFDVLRALRADPRWADLPVVMYSAWTDPEAQQSAMQLGAREFVVKGRMDFAQLKAVVERNLRPV
jgi:CheY-like chemotaxis protein